MNNILVFLLNLILIFILLILITKYDNKKEEMKSLSIRIGNSGEPCLMKDGIPGIVYNDSKCIKKNDYMRKMNKQIFKEDKLKQNNSIREYNQKVKQLKKEIIELQKKIEKLKKEIKNLEKKKI